MRKFLSILICTICLGFSSVQARANVTNQLEEITAQLENLDQVIQWFIDNQDNLDSLVDTDFNYYLSRSLAALSQIRNAVIGAQGALVYDIAPDVDSIQKDVATLTANVASYVSQIVASINGTSAEIDDLHQWFIHIGLDRIQDMLTQAQLDNSLDSFLFDLMYEFQNSSSIFSQILQSIQSLDTTSGLQQSLNSIADALTQFGNVSIYLDLVEELENLDLNLNLDISSSLSGIEYDLSNILNTLYNFSSAFNHFLQNFQTFQADQLHMYGHLTQFIDWYQGSFFDGLETWGTRHSEWLSRQLERETAEDEHWEKVESVFEDDTSFPTDSYVPLDVQLNEVDLDVPDEPDYEIQQAADKVETDMEDVTYALEGAMDDIDSSVSSFLEGVKFEWGKLNSVLSFSFTPPLSDYTMELSYDFSELEWLPVCRSVSTGIWGIVLFVNSFLAISKTLHAVIEN